MKLADLQLQAEGLPPEERRKLISFLVALNIRSDDQFRSELTRRLDDRNPESWINLDEAENRLKQDGV